MMQQGLRKGSYLQAGNQQGVPNLLQPPCAPAASEHLPPGSYAKQQHCFCIAFNLISNPSWAIYVHEAVQAISWPCRHPSCERLQPRLD